MKELKSKRVYCLFALSDEKHFFGHYDKHQAERYCVRSIMLVLSRIDECGTFYICNNFKAFS
ncbi:MAG: hypothetical protein AMJ60_05145 [Desulfobacterales bacterium SG8_35]|nr:MAG: hypothetical protein AMJ60_05145 [Desulfobacterales bacterium SG8_35]